MSGDDNNSNNGNRTVFRPSPLSGLKKPEGQPGAAPPPPSPAGGGWGSPPVPPSPPGGGQGGGQGTWGAPPPPPSQPASGWASQAASPTPPRPQPFGSAPTPPQGGAFAPPPPPSHDPLAPVPGVTPGNLRRARLNDEDIPLPARAPYKRSPLVTEAGPVLALAASIRSGRAGISMPDFHREASNLIAGYDSAIAQLYPDEVRLRARYAVCATVDDIAQNLPNVGGDGAEWARRSLVVQFFRENIGGERFWQLVNELLERPQQNAELIELYAACLAAGFEGKYRVQPDGRSQLQQIIARLYGALEHPRSQSTLELAPNWRGIDAPLGKIGLWSKVLLAAAAAAAALFLIYVVLRLLLATAGSDSWDAVKALTPAEPLRFSRVGTPPPAPPASTQLQRLQQFLEPEIRQKLVVVEEDGSTVRVRTTVGQLFKSGSDQLEDGRAALFERIGRAVEGEPGQVSVEGYSDSDKISGLQFPDNTALSLARAKTVGNILAGVLSNPGRISTQGFGESRPIASNDTPEGKALNRRVEIVIPRQP